MSADGSVGEKGKPVFDVRRDRPVIRVGISEQDAPRDDRVVRQELAVIAGSILESKRYDPRSMRASPGGVTKVTSE